MSSMTWKKGIDAKSFYGSKQMSPKKSRRKSKQSVCDENEIPGKKRLMNGFSAKSHTNTSETSCTPETQASALSSSSTEKFYSHCFPKSSQISSEEFSCLSDGLNRSRLNKLSNTSKERTNRLHRLNGGNTNRHQMCRRESDPNGTALKVKLNMSSLLDEKTPIKATNDENCAENKKRAKSPVKITKYFKNKSYSSLNDKNNELETPVKRASAETMITPLLSNPNLSLNSVPDFETPKSCKQLSHNPIEANETEVNTRLFDSNSDYFNDQNIIDCDTNVWLESPKESDILEPNRPIGLKNLGNTCYMNSIVQSIFALKFFVEDLDLKLNELKTICNQSLDFSMTQKLLNLYNQYNGLRTNGQNCSFDQLVKDLSDLKECVGKKSSPFLSGSQQDAAEFFTHVIDSIAEEFESTAEPLNEKNSNPIWRTFGFETGGSLTCKSCKNKTNIEKERFHALYLSIPEDNSLQTGFNDFLKDETTRHQCVRSDCNANENVLNKCFTKLSKVLFIQLGRYTEDGSKRTEELIVPQVIHLSVKLSQTDKVIAPSPLATPYRSKLQNASICNRVPTVVRKITFDNLLNNENNGQNVCNNSNKISLDSDQELSKNGSDIQNQTNCVNETNELNEELNRKENNMREEWIQSTENEPNSEHTNQKLKYQLVAVICHHGLTLSVGHYTSYVYSIESDQWFQCDDNYIRLTNLESVLKYSQLYGYCFFYAVC